MSKINTSGVCTMNVKVVSPDYQNFMVPKFWAELRRMVTSVRWRKAKWINGLKLDIHRLYTSSYQTPTYISIMETLRTTTHELKCFQMIQGHSKMPYHWLPTREPWSWEPLDSPWQNSKHPWFLLNYILHCMSMCEMVPGLERPITLWESQRPIYSTSLKTTTVQSNTHIQGDPDINRQKNRDFQPKCNASVHLIDQSSSVITHWLLPRWVSASQPVRSLDEAPVKGPAGCWLSDAPQIIQLPPPGNSGWGCWHLFINYREVRTLLFLVPYA